MLFQIVLLLLLLIITAVISIASYLTDKGEHTAFYKINNNVYIKNSKIINYYIVLILYSSHTHHIRKHTHTHTRTHAHTHTLCLSVCVSLSHTHTHTQTRTRTHTHTIPRPSHKKELSNQEHINGHDYFSGWDSGMHVPPINRRPVDMTA